MAIIRKVNLSDLVLDYLINAIETNYWKQGDKLPNEIELSSSLKVSRNILRESMKILENFGILESTPGKGTFICKNAMNNIASYKFFEVLRNTPSIETFLEVRLSVEPYIVKKVAEIRTEEDVKFLKNILSEIEIKASAMEYVFQDDFYFHTNLARMSKNEILENLIISIFEQLRNTKYTQISVHVEKEAYHNSVSHHTRIINAIIDKNGEEAAKVVYEHLHNRIMYIKSKYVRG